MTKITVVKEEPEMLSGGRYEPRRGSRLFLVILVLVAFLSGVAGSIGGLVFLSSTTIGANWRQSLGIKDSLPINLNRTRTDKIVVEESSAIIKAVNKVKPAVVSITGESKKGLFGISVPTTAGSGFIITSDGLIVTNRHVVSDENTKYSVYSAEGKQYSANVLARDPYNDLAILKIDAKSLPVVELGDSDELAIGQWVIAIGNALGEFQNTVTVGVVSAKNRSVEPADPTSGQTEQLEGLIQTDTAIFSGNSGGPLVNLAGQVVGINTAKGPDQGLGFAIPINSIKSALDSVQKSGKIIRPMIGVRYIPVTRELSKSQNLPVDYGVLLYANEGEQAVVPGSPAAEAGLKNGDIITHINNDRIDDSHPLKSLVQQYKPGDEVTLKILRDRKEKTLKLKLAELK